MKLIPIEEREDAPQVLWDLLAERTPEQNISHKEMPTWEEHLTFIGRRPGPWASGERHPYADWCIIEATLGHTPVGSIYLTHANEIGVFIFRQFQRCGFASAALKLFLDKHGRDDTYFANVNPKNTASKAFWAKHGFKPLQETYALEPA